MNVRVRGWVFVSAQFALIALSVLAPGSAENSPNVALARVLFVAGGIGLVVAFINLGSSLTAHPEPLARAALKVHGLYRFVRHPIYAALILLMLGSTLLAPSGMRWLAFGALVALLIFKARWEETLLRKRYPEYAEYAMRVPMLVPFMRRISR